MTEFESKCYGMTEQAIRTQYMGSFTAKTCGLEMVVMGVLSDAQELMSMGQGLQGREAARKQMNIAKYILSEMMDQKESV